MKSKSDKTLRSHTQPLEVVNPSPKVNFRETATEPETTKLIPAWKLWVPLLIQISIILALPAQAVYTRLTGKTVILQTAPVDPYHPLRGYSVTLRYDISGVGNLKKLPGWAELVKQNPSGNPDPRAWGADLAQGTSFYIVLEQPKSSNSNVPQAWKPVRISDELPDIADNQVALKGRYNYGAIEYGLETYYIPEEQREQINEDISQSWQNGQNQSNLVEVKVDARGRAVPISFWVRDAKARNGLHNYRF